MPSPDISLKPGQIAVTPLTSSSSGINGIGVLSGQVVKTYNNQMGYNVGNNISYFNRDSIQFTNGDDNTPYSLVNQRDVIFKINALP